MFHTAIVATAYAKTQHIQKEKVWRQSAYPEEGCGKTCSEINARYSTPVQL